MCSTSEQDTLDHEPDRVSIGTAKSLHIVHVHLRACPCRIDLTMPGPLEGEGVRGRLGGTEIRLDLPRDLWYARHRLT